MNESMMIDNKKMKMDQLEESKDHWDKKNDSNRYLLNTFASEIDLQAAIKRLKDY